MFVEGRARGDLWAGNSACISPTFPRDFYSAQKNFLGYTSTNMIYAIRSGTAGPIKIGRATNPIKRMGELQTAHHDVLNLLAAVRWDNAVEKRLHFHLKEFRLTGEWFEPSELVLWVVEMMRDFESYHLLFSRLDPDCYPPPCHYENQLRLYKESRESKTNPRPS